MKEPGERGIANPLKKATLHGENADDYFVTYEDGKAIAKRRPKVKITRVEGGLQGQIIVSKQDFERVKQDVFEKHGIDINKITYTIEETQNPSLSFFILAPQAPVLFEGLKIAYEFTVTAIPTYFGDDWAKRISAFLHTGENEALIKARVESVNNILPSFEAELVALQKIPAHIHAIILKQKQNIGLVCFVKIFDRVFPYHISDQKYLTTFDREIGTYNDCLEQTNIWLMDLRWRDIRLHLTLDNLDESEQIQVQAALSVNNDSISWEPGQIPVFTKDGETYATSLVNIIPTTFKDFQVIDFNSGLISFNASMADNLLFIKYTPTNRLIELAGLEATYEIAY